MHVSWQEAADLAKDCGFFHAVLAPAKAVGEYVPNAEGIRAKIGTDPFALLPKAKSVLIAAWPFSWFSPWPEGTGEVSAYYFHSHKAYQGLNCLLEQLVQRGVQAVPGTQLPLKLLARDAGLGVIGRNTLLHNDAWGSSMVLCALVTDIAPQLDIKPLAAKSCSNNCMQCVRSCPTKALFGDGQLDTERCLRVRMMTGETVPEPMRKPMGNRLLGCEICQRACPNNKGINTVPPCADSFSLETLLAPDRESLSAIASQIGGNEARTQRLQAQAALVAGNLGDAKYLPPLQALAEHTRPAIAEHAAWAISNITGGTSYASTDEPDQILR